MQEYDCNSINEDGSKWDVWPRIEWIQYNWLID